MVARGLNVGPVAPSVHLITPFYPQRTTHEAFWSITAKRHYYLCLELPVAIGMQNSEGNLGEICLLDVAQRDELECCDPVLITI